MSIYVSDGRLTRAEIFGIYLGIWLKRLAITAFILFLVFFMLKSAGHLAWSWWLITVPLWGTVALALGSIGVFVIFVYISNYRKENP